MTRFNRIISIYIFLLSCLFITQQAAASLLSDLQDGQHVLLMRHADAPGYGASSALVDSTPGH